MRAVVYEQYGGPEVFRLEEAPKPAPKPKEVRVRVHAVCINDWDWALMRGVQPRLGGLLRPKLVSLGSDIAGVVDAVGDEVTAFSVGDRVWGDLSTRWGGIAEYVCTETSMIRPLPDGISFVDAAATPQAGLLAWQALKKADLQGGETVLFNGGGGGVGAYGVQMARHLGATTVDGIDRGDKLAAMRDWGFSQVFDYQSYDFTKSERRYDVIVDPKTIYWPMRYFRPLKPGGRYITVGGKNSKLLLVFCFGPLAHRFTNKRIKVLPLKTNEGLSELGSMMVDGSLVSHVDRVYPLEQTADAFQRFEAGDHQGKLVIKVVP